MAPVTLENARLELRRDEKGKMTLLFDGERVPGVMEIEVVQKPGLRPIVNVMFIGTAVRITDPVSTDGDAR